jgi:hypothetical protein
MSTTESLDNGFPTVVHLHMSPLATLEQQSARLIKLPKPYPILLVNRVQSKWDDGVLVPEQNLLVDRRTIFIRNSLASKPCALFWNNRLILREYNQHECLERHQVYLICCVLFIQLIVDGGQEVVRGKVGVKVGGVSKILRLSDCVNFRPGFPSRYALTCTMVFCAHSL